MVAVLCFCIHGVAHWLVESLPNLTSASTNATASSRQAQPPVAAAASAGVAAAAHDAASAAGGPPRASATCVHPGRCTPRGAQSSRNRPLAVGSSVSMATNTSSGTLRPAAREAGQAGKGRRRAVASGSSRQKGSTEPCTYSAAGTAVAAAGGVRALSLAQPSTANRAYSTATMANKAPAASPSSRGKQSKATSGLRWCRSSISFPSPAGEERQTGGRPARCGPAPWLGPCPGDHGRLQARHPARPCRLLPATGAGRGAGPPTFPAEHVEGEVRAVGVPPRQLQDAVAGLQVHPGQVLNVAVAAGAHLRLGMGPSTWGCEWLGVCAGLQHSRSVEVAAEAAPAGVRCHRSQQASKQRNHALPRAADLTSLHSACTCCFSTKTNTKPRGTRRRSGTRARCCRHMARGAGTHKGASGRSLAGPGSARPRGLKPTHMLVLLQWAANPIPRTPRQTLPGPAPPARPRRRAPRTPNRG